MTPILPIGLLSAFAGVTLYAIVPGVIRRRRSERRAMLFDVLAAAARHGRPLGPVLECASRAAKKPARSAALAAAAEAVAGGEALSDALAHALPTEVPAPVADAIRAAEGTRRLPTALEALASDATREAVLAHRTASATVYPALLGVGLISLHLGVLEGLLASVAGSLDDSSAEAAVAPVAVARWVFLAVSAALCLPWLLERVVPRATDAASARWLRTLSTGLDAGLSLRAALKFAGGASGERRLADATRVLSTGVDAGKPLAGALPTLPFPPRVQARLTAVEGVPSPALLREIADACTRRHTARRERWIRWAVPVATVLVGLVIAIDYSALTGLWRRAAELARS